MTIKIHVVKPTIELITPTTRLEETLTFLETAGRTCYKSEKKITHESSNAFIRMLIKSGHESVIEHESVTIRFTGSRSMSHQLVRHRLAAYSQESQRYCDYSGDNKGGYQVICPPKVANVPPGTYWQQYGIWSGNGDWCRAAAGVEIPDVHVIEFLNDVSRAFEAYERYRERGVPAEDARCVLPNATKTEVVATFNLRTWRHIFSERALNPHAQWEIQGLMRDALGLLHTHLPVIFEDQFETLLRMHGVVGH